MSKLTIFNQEKPESETISIINGLIQSHKEEMESINKALELHKSIPETLNAYNLLIGNTASARSSAYSFGKHRDKDTKDLSKMKFYAECKSKSAHWSTLLSLVPELKSTMTSSERAELNSQIHGDLKSIPEFNQDNIKCLFKSKLENSSLHLANCVDELFAKLSGSHSTNQPEGFSKKIIYKSSVDKFGKRSFVDSEYLSDTICDFRKILQLLFKRNKKSDISANEIIKLSNNKWHSIDDGLFEIKLFKGGTVHINLRKDVAIKLNTILSVKYPNSIPLKRKSSGLGL